MRILDLDFRKRRTAKWAGALVLIVGLAGAAASGVQYTRVSDELAMTEAAMRESGNTARRPTTATRSEGDRQNAALEVKRANDIIHQLNLPWDELFASVEAAGTSNVALLSIESDIDNGRIKISGEAKDLEGMLEYSRSLKTRPKLADIYLQSHEFQQQDPQHPVRFVLTANWLVRK
jgi:hypothetical protein